MIVCHCIGVSDQEIRRTVREGASSVADVAQSCGAGSCCGGCHPALDQIITEGQPAIASKEEAPFVPAFAGTPS